MHPRGLTSTEQGNHQHFADGHDEGQKREWVPLIYQRYQRHPESSFLIVPRFPGKDAKPNCTRVFFLCIQEANLVKEIIW